MMLQVFHHSGWPAVAWLAALIVVGIPALLLLVQTRWISSRCLHQSKKRQDFRNGESDAAGCHEEAHYAASAAAFYEADFSTPGAYRSWQLAIVRDALELGQWPSEQVVRLADVGGGNGEFALACLSTVGTRQGWELEVVEPSAAMRAAAVLCDAVDGGAGHVVKYVALDAATWASCGGGGGSSATHFSHILLKEVIHHLADGERARFFAAVREHRLLPSGLLLIVTRPKVEVDYPLWPAAREVWAACQPSEHELTAALREAGFESVTCTRHSFTIDVALERWLALIRARFWSTFASFDDKTLAEGCEAIRGSVSVDARGHIHFDDRLVFIVAKPVGNTERPQC